MRCSWTPTAEVLHRGNYPDTHEVQLKHQTELQLSESVTLNAESRAQSPQVYNRWSTTAGLQAPIETCDANLEGCDARHVQDVKMWNAAADPAYEGDCDEQTNLGYAYLSGRGVAINISTAVYWWTKASNQVELALMHTAASQHVACRVVPKPTDSWQACIVSIFSTTILIQGIVSYTT